MTVRAILTADNHLDPTALNFGPDRFQRKRDFLQCFDEVVDYAKKEKPELFLIGGDLFDIMRPSNAVRAAVMKDLKSLHERGVRVFAVSGHHDTPKSIEEGVSPLAVYGNSGLMHYFGNPSSPETIAIDVGGFKTTITGVGHNPLHEGGNDPLEAIRSTLEGDFNIVIAHAPVQGFSGETGDEPIIKASALPKELNLLVVGHFHNHQSKKIGPTQVIYPGSTERVDFAEEEDAKGFVWAEFGKDGTISKDFVKTIARQYKTIRVPFPEGLNPIQGIKDEVTKSFAKDLVLRIRLYGATSTIGLTGYRRPDLLNYCRGKVFHTFVDEGDLEVRVPDRPVSGPRTSPLEELTRYFSGEMQKAAPEEMEILREALQLSQSKLQEAGAW